MSKNGIRTQKFPIPIQWPEHFLIPHKCHKILFISLDRSPVNGLFLLFLKTLKEGINAMFEKHRKVSHFYNILSGKRATFMYFQTIHLNFRAVLTKKSEKGAVRCDWANSHLAQKFNWDILDVFPNIVLGKNSSKLLETEALADFQ